MDQSILLSMDAALGRALSVLRTIYDGELVERELINLVGQDAFMTRMAFQAELVEVGIMVDDEIAKDDPVQLGADADLAGSPAPRTKQPTKQQEETALTLLSIDGADFVKIPKKNASYITLDIWKGKSKNNKNAVTISRNGVTFMVSDFSEEQKASALGFITDRIHNDTRLRFIGLDSLAIAKNEETKQLFARLLAAAKLTSADRQK